MAFISELSPDGGTSKYDLKDKNAQTKNLSTPIEIGGQQKTTVEDCLDALAKSGGGEGSSDIFVKDTTLYVPTRANVVGNKLIIGSSSDMNVVLAGVQEGIGS